MNFSRALLSGLEMVALGASSLVACSSTTYVVAGADGGGGSDGGDPNLPEVPSRSWGPTAPDSARRLTVTSDLTGVAEAWPPPFAERIAPPACAPRR